MTYEEALARIHEFNRFGSRLGLERIRLLLELLGDPQKDMQVIHVAGTNGKGSVCRFLYCALREMGYKVGIYTSPFLERFTERIEFDGAEISPEDLASCAGDVLQQAERVVEIRGESPTEFEVVTAIAFLYYSRKPMDFLVLEVGLGGSGDSTNVIEKPLLSIITNIDFDHMQQLGNTLEAIAGEKAGIIKAGCPVVHHVKDAGAAKVIEDIAREKGCWCVNAERGGVANVRERIEGSVFDAVVRDSLYRDMTLSMGGRHQIENALTALTALELLEAKGVLTLQPETVRAGMKKARQPGRLEILRREPYLIIDGAHNVAGVRALAAAVNGFFAGKRTLLVTGMLADKEVDAMIELFGTIPGDFAATEPDSARKLPAEELCRKIQQTGRSCLCLGDWKKACEYITSHLDEYEVCIAAGSLYLIGNIRGYFCDGFEQ